MGEAGKAAASTASERTCRCVSAERSRQRSPASSRRDSPRQRQCQPPSTIRSTPLTAVFSSRNTTASTISSIRASRPIGVSEVYFSIAAGLSDQYGLLPTMPGWIELTRIGLSSSTSVRVVRRRRR